MELFLWFLAAVTLWTLGGFYSTRGLRRSAPWLLMGNIGFGLCCIFLGMLCQQRPVLGHAFWVHLLWSTLLLTVPAWVAFSHRFARPEGTHPGGLERLLLALLWIGAAVLLVLGNVRAPVEAGQTAQGRTLLILLAPFGSWVVFHILAGVVLLLWNLQATLEAARATGRRRTSRAIYALLPLVMTSLYILAELLLYRQQRAASSDLLLAATLLSSFAFAGTIGRGRLEDLTLPVGHRIVLSSVVLTALGAFFVGLALLAGLLRGLGVSADAAWYERAIVGLLAVLFSLWILPGIREEIGRFLDRRLLAPRFAGPGIWTRVEQAARAVDRVEDLALVLRLLLRERFGELSFQLWAFEPLAGEYAPVGSADLPRFGPKHPLVRALIPRRQPLRITGEASRIEDIPLHVACEEIATHHGLRVFLPIRRRGDLVGVLGCGPGGRRTLHPEDIDVLQRITERLGQRVAALVQIDSDRARENGEGLEPVEVGPWLEGIVRRIRQEKPEGPRIHLELGGTGPLSMDRRLLEPVVEAFFRDARGLQGAKGRQVAITVRNRPAGRLSFAVGEEEVQLRLRLSGAAAEPCEDERDGTRQSSRKREG